MFSHRNAPGLGGAVRSALASVAIGALLAISASSVADAAPQRVHGIGQRGVIADHYIVLMGSHTSRAAMKRLMSEAVARGAKPEYTYTNGALGFAAMLPPRALALVRNSGQVSFIEADSTTTPATTSQTPAPWNLDRIDVRAWASDNTYHYTPTGRGVKAYVIDSGIRFSHHEFGGRAISGYDAVDGGSADDCSGHGTHVAGTIGGSTYGVAKEVTLVAVRVFDCHGGAPVSRVIAALGWIIAVHRSGEPAVANMSLGGPQSSSLELYVRFAIADGVTVVAAAGNTGGTACMNSPANVADAITVAATNKFDRRAPYSAYGTCVDLFAPGDGWPPSGTPWGSGISSAWSSGDDDVQQMNGTSVAAAHVSGDVALYLQGHPLARPATVGPWINAQATPGVVADAGQFTPNRLLYAYHEPCAVSDRISNDRLLLAAANECIQSADGRYRFVMQSDGNLVLYGPSGRGLWSSRTVGSGAHNVRQQGDGNLVIYRANGHAVWSSRTQNNPGAVLVVQNDGNVVIYRTNGRAIWSTRTAGRQ